MAIRYALFIVIFLSTNVITWSRYRSRKFGRRCYFCPKPLSNSIKQCMGTVSEMESEIVTKLDGYPSPIDLSRDEFVDKPNPDLAKELMDTFAWVRCFAMMVNNFFSTREIQKINDIALSLTEINRNPKVCVFDNFMTDCQAVDTKNATSLYAQLQKQWLILDVLLQNVGDEQ